MGSIFFINLLVYRNATDFCMLTMYTATLLSSLISSAFWLSLGFPIYKIMSSASRQFYFFLSNSDTFYFSYLTALGSTCSIMLNRSSKSRHPCFVPDLRGNVFNLLPLSTLVVWLSFMAFIMLTYVPSTPNLLRVFITNGC